MNDNHDKHIMIKNTLARWRVVAALHNGRLALSSTAIVMKKLLLVGVVLVAASNANADKVVRALPNVYVGNWCGDDSNELHRCKDGDHVAIRVERHSYVVP